MRKITSTDIMRAVSMHDIQQKCQTSKGKHCLKCFFTVWSQGVTIIVEARYMHFCTSSKHKTRLCRGKLTKMCDVLIKMKGKKGDFPHD